MDQFFTDSDYNAPQIVEETPQQNDFSYNETQPTLAQQPQASEANNFDFSGYSNVQPVNTLPYNENTQNDFNQFEQDETTRRIRQDEERVQNSLRQKSKEWTDKNERQSQGRKQLQQFQAKKEQQKQQRAKQNVQKEERLRQQYNKLKGESGWHKVVSSINVRQGEHKGKKDINRMREAIMHRRQDQSGR